MKFNPELKIPDHIDPNITGATIVLLLSLGLFLANVIFTVIIMIQFNAPVVPDQTGSLLNQVSVQAAASLLEDSVLFTTEKTDK